MKQGGVWKDAPSEKIKVNGVWKEAIKKFIKNSGKWVDLDHLSANTLDYDMTIAKDTDSSRYLVEKNDPANHKAQLQSGYASPIGASETLLVPINAEINLGSELLCNVTLVDDTCMSRDVTVATFAGGVMTMTLPVAGDKNIDQKITYVVGKKYIVSCIIENVDAQLAELRITFGGTKLLELVNKGKGTTQTLTGEFVATHTNHTVQFRVYGQPGQKGKFSKPSLKEGGITAVHGSVTVFNHATQKFEQNTALPLSQNLAFGHGYWGTIVKLHTASFSQADLDAFTLRPELIIEWGLGTKTIPSGITKGADDKVYEALKELGGVDTLDKSYKSESWASQFGVQSLLLKKDANGIPTGMAKAGTIEKVGVGSWVKLPMVDPMKQQHHITKCLTRIHGDITAVVDVECTP